MYATPFPPESGFRMRPFGTAQAPIVGIDCRYVGARPSGIGEVVQALIDHAPGLAPDLRFLLLKHPSAPDRLSDAENVEEVVVPHTANSVATMWFLSRVVDLSRLALFHAPSNIMPAGLQVPCIATVHDIMWITQPELCQPKLWRPAEAWFYRHGIMRALNRAELIATVSQATSSAIGSFAPETRSRLRVTMSGVSSDFRPRKAPTDVLRRLGLSSSRRYVLTVGQNAPYKNHAGALAAFASAFGTREDIDFVLVQRRTQGVDQLRGQAEALGLGARVHFLSALTRDELVMLYGSAVALLHPSICEGFGNPLAEAMACGCPVVTSDRSAMPEVTAGAALLVDPYDVRAIAAALRRVVDDPELAADLSARGIARAKDLSWTAFAEANVGLYRETIRQRAVGARRVRDTNELARLSPAG